MRELSSGELSRMRDTQESAMQDTCRVLAYSSEADDYGNPSPTYTAGSAISCGLKLTGPDELHGSGDVPVIDGEIRLPLSTSVGPDDRIRVTHRYGKELSSYQTFDVEGPIKRGPTGLVADVTEITDG